MSVLARQHVVDEVAGRDGASQDEEVASVATRVVITHVGVCRGLHHKCINEVRAG